MFYSLPLKAGQEYVLSAAGRVFLIDSTGAASTVTVKFLRNGSELKTIPGRKKAFKAVIEFDGVSLLSAVDATVDIFISFNDVDIGLDDGVHVQVDNEDAAPVPVKTPEGEPLQVLFSGTVEPVLGVVTVDNTDAEAIPTRPQALTVIDDKLPVTVGTVATALVSDATLRKLRIRNAHETAVVAIGGAGVTMENGAIQLQPGDVWIEDDAASAAWYAISDTEDTVIQVQALK